ncbi:MAG: hypothetical protein Q8L48_26490 [Archangium sp.]|nr:hypothetical protein [Archangium sp.]
MLGERDYVMRLVKQLAEFIARALIQASSQKSDEALATLRAACGQSLGMEYEVLSMLDAKSAVELLGEPARVLAFIQLVEAMGDVDSRTGESLRASTRYQHALELAAALGTPANEVATRLRTKLSR